MRTRLIKPSDRKSTRKVTVYCQSGRMAFQAMVSVRKATRNPAFAHTIQHGMAPPRAVMKMSSRSEAISITTQAVMIKVRFEMGLLFVLFHYTSEKLPNGD